MSLKNKIIQDVKRRKLSRALSDDSSQIKNDDADAVVDSLLTSGSTTSFEAFSEYKDIQLHRFAAEKMRIESPFFKVHEGLSQDTSMIAGREMLNFSSYDYLGINGDSRQTSAVKAALDIYGVSSSASRLVSGERPIQGQLESKLAELHGVDDAAIFVSGHATNVSTIGCLFNSADLIVHDALVHNSVLEGVQLSGARRATFPHNDIQALEKILVDSRHKYRRTLVVVEGLYSMDGDYPDLPRLIALKDRHDALLMVDEAHSVGVMGELGRGIAEHFNIDAHDVDIWMGTLSKSFASTGGYIAGSSALVDMVKNLVPGFVYSVGVAPVMAAAALTAIDILHQEPERVAKLKANARLFDSLAKKQGIDTGLNRQLAVIPVMMGDSINAVKAAHLLSEAGVNVQPIIHPAVEERLARLRFFICSSHNATQIEQAVEALAKVMRELDLI